MQKRLGTFRTPETAAAAVFAYAAGPGASLGILELSKECLSKPAPTPSAKSGTGVTGVFIRSVNAQYTLFEVSVFSKTLGRYRNLFEAGQQVSHVKEKIGRT